MDDAPTPNTLLSMRLSNWGAFTPPRSAGEGISPRTPDTPERQRRSIWKDTQRWWERQAVGLKENGLRQHLLSEWEAKKNSTLKGLLRQGGPTLKRTLGWLGEVIQDSATSDPDMWNWVRPMLRSLVSSLWDDIEMEIEHGLKNYAFEKPAQETREERCRHDPAEARGCRKIGLKIRAWTLSHYVPHNRSVFGRLKDPAYLLMTASTMLPVFGIRVFFFSMILLMLLVPGPPDEYQLINFILIFKGTQFFTSGVISAYVGAMEYFACYLLGGDDLRGCIETRGPGATDGVIYLVFDYIGSICLVWIAFLALPKSRSRKPHWEHTLDHRPVETRDPEVYCCCLKGVPMRGGRLRALLRYDFCGFMLSLVMFVPILVDTAIQEPTYAKFAARAKQTIFWCRILYSLLSLPFVIFIIPGLGRVLTHSVNTGYDSTGACLEFAYPGAAPEKVHNAKAG